MLHARRVLQVPGQRSLAQKKLDAALAAKKAARARGFKAPQQASVRSFSTRDQSTAAAVVDYEDDFVQSSEGRKSHQEAWGVNLGRFSDNDWLTGPRDKEWFTGVAPADCPGKLHMILVSVYPF